MQKQEHEENMRIILEKHKNEKEELIRLNTEEKEKWIKAENDLKDLLVQYGILKEELDQKNKIISDCVDKIKSLE